jgi:hypothetical protein
MGGPSSSEKAAKGAKGKNGVATKDAGVNATELHEGWVVGRTYESLIQEIMALPPDERDVRLVEFVREEMQDAENRSRREIQRLMDDK